MTTVDEYARHSAYSDPGAYAHLLDELPDGIAPITDAVRNTVIHYKSGVEIRHDEDIDSRWIERILATDQQRHHQPLSVAKPDVEKVAGCCRDYALLTVSALRQKGIPARTRVGFATYFFPGFHVDHVLAELWDGDRWRFVDGQIAPGPMWPMDTQDIPLSMGRDPGDKPLFLTAAQAWAAYRRGEVDPMAFGVHPEVPELCGAGFMAGEVGIELTHRMRDELLLWDLHGIVGEGPTADPGVIDEIADLMLRADEGDADAETRLGERYLSDANLHPGDVVRCASPRGITADINLRTRQSSLDGQ